MMKRNREHHQNGYTKRKVFLVVMYGCKSWTIKKADHQRIDVLNCGVGEDQESLGLQGDQTSQL